MNAKRLLIFLLCCLSLIAFYTPTNPVKANGSSTMWGVNQYYGGSSTFETALSLATLQKVKDAGMQFVVLWAWTPRTQNQIVTAAARMKSIGLEPWVCLPKVANDAKTLVTALGANCSYYEVLKEPHISGSYSYADPQTYAQIWRDVVTACRTVNPTAWYGGPVVGSPRTSPRSVEWMEVWLDECEDIIDPATTFISYHSYTSFGSGTKTQILAKALTMHRDDLIQVKALCQQHLGHNLNVAVTEFSWTAEPNDDRWDLDSAFITEWTQTSMATLEAYDCWAAQFWWLGGYTGWDNTMSILDAYGNAKPQYDAIVEYLATEEETYVPYASSISYNSSLANSPTMFSCYWRDVEGLSKAYFSTNNTGAWANSTIISLVGVASWANKTVTLNDTSGVTVQFQWFCNDTDNNWSATAIQSLIVESSLNSPYFSNPSSSTTFAGKPCTFTVTWQDAEALDGYIFGTNNTGTWHNETWTGWTGDPTLAYASKTKTLNTTVGVAVKWEVWANDTDDNWGDTEGLFLVTAAEYEFELFFASDALHDENSLLAADGDPYLYNSTGIITDLAFSTQFTFSVNATGTATTILYTNRRGWPTSVSGATYTYDSPTDMITLATTHSSIVLVVIEWGNKLYFNASSSLGFQNDVNTTVVITVTSGALNCTNPSIALDWGGGAFTFLSGEDTTLQVDAVNMERLYAQGDSGNDRRYIDSGTILTVLTGNTVTIGWGKGIVDNLSWLIMPVMGLFGFFMSGFGLFYVGNKIRERDAFESIRACLVAMAFILIGAGLIIGWLW